MKKIQMVDLQGQYEGIKNEVNASFQEVFDSTAFINGPQVHSFQKEMEEYLGVKHVIPCANGTDALQIAMMGLDLKPGDEVITADFTFAATVEVIALLQLTPVLVDVDPETFNIDPEAVKRAITPRTRAIVPVHLFGQAANMDAIMDIAREHKLYVIEDNAQAIGANYHSSEGKTKKAGTIGDIAATSFFPSKNLGGYGDGGAIFTDNNSLAHTIRGIVNHGMYERYHHDVVGVNSRLDSFQAAVLRAKLPKLDLYNQARRDAAQKYNEALKGESQVITPVLAGKDDTHVYHQYTLQVKNGKRDALAKHLQEKGIPFGIYYPIPLHKQKAYEDPRYNDKDFPVTNRLVKEVISLPMHTELEDDQIDFIATTIKDFLNS
ncbi:transcriptional regulator [Christiangramia fulva]|uniref:Transcriptional regulator n=1 Tax=Christiangramia fulva TaxID=2126553 RepID=A0A2R3Z5D3_9FLAO|nr:DegT/DnrJ/EryC1/StrS family aminotransferase [Christiangramia fulva]AVR45448.1 transcriptional regulator [Christiangramia fulva]